MISCCLDHVLAIGRAPSAEWKERIAQIPETCQSTDRCSHPEIGCRERCTEILRVQYKAAQRRQREQAPAPETFTLTQGESNAAGYRGRAMEKLHARRNK